MAKVTMVVQPMVDFHALEEAGFIPHDQDYNSDADQLSEFAGRSCYAAWGRPNPKTANNRGYLANILEKGHYSIFEHAHFGFYIVGCSRSFTHELVRHRHLGFSMLSQRYVPQGESEYVEPDGLSDDDAEELRDLHRQSLELYRDIEARGIMDGEPKKVYRQRARAALLGSTKTNIVVTGNVRAWREVILKRTAVDAEGNPLADLEFHEIAKKIERQITVYAPNSMQDFGKKLIEP